MNAFTLKLEPKHKISTLKDITVNLSIKNNLDTDCYITKDVIMLDGFRNDKFTIVDQKGKSVPYIGIMAKYYPETIVLKAHETLSTDINLVNGYDFQGSGAYNVHYETIAQCCLDYEGNNCLDPETTQTDANIIIFDFNV